MKTLFVSVLCSFVLLCISATETHANPYYIAPDKDLDGSSPNIQGSDTNNGLSPSTSLKTFSRTFDIIRSNHTSGNILNQPVTIILLDGMYLQSFHPLNLEGTDSHRLTLKSANDGKAIIDGQYSKRPIILDHWSANDGFVFEGLVARNSSNSVIHVRYGGSYITLRRVSAYNASNTKNEHPIWMDATSNVLLEDVVTGGTGRKQVLIYGRSDNVTLRRVFSLHGGWKGGDPSYIPNWWPQADGIEFYGTVGGIITNSTMENVINFGKNTSYGISVAPNRTTISNVNILGSIAVHGGKDIDGTSVGYVDNRCDPDNPSYNGCYPEWTQQCVQCGKNTSELSIRTGFTFGVWESSGQIFQNNTFQDLLSWGNLGAGLAAGAPWGSSSTNNVLRNVTIKGNNNGTPKTKEPGEQVKSGSLNMTSVAEADIEGYPEHSGKGARLTHRYVNRQLTNEPLWPWPMEERIREEYSRELGIQNFSVTCRVGSIINAQTKTSITYLNVNSYCNGTATPSPTVSPMPTHSPTPTIPPTPLPTKKPGYVTPIAVSASSHDGNIPENAIDNILETRWSADGIGQWIQFDLGSTKNIESIEIAWYQGDQRTSTFDILGSTDNQTWNTIKSQVTSSGTTINFETYQFPSTQLQFLRIVGHGNSQSTWNSINEIYIYLGTSSTKYDPKFDLNEDGSVNLLDIIDLVKSLFNT